MADYQPLIAKLIDGVDDPAARLAIYDRARSALSEQLHSVEPRLTHEQIEREVARLETVIGTLESGATSSLPPATFIQTGAPPRRPPVTEKRPQRPVSRLQAPEPETVAIRRGGRRRAPLGLLAVLTLLAVPVAFVAWKWREQPRGSEQVSVEPATLPSQQAAPASDAKYNERVVGGTATRADPAPAARPSQNAPAAQTLPLPQASAPPVQPTPAPAAIAVSQRALLFEENQAEPQKPGVTVGTAVWRLDAIAGGQGMPLETVVRGNVEFSGAGLALNIVLRRNVDTALPASHTIEMSFITQAVAGGQARVVRDVGLPQMRPEESVRGVPVAGLPVPVKENIFLIGLSDLKGDVERNTELLVRRNWMELPLRFASGQKAALLIDKGVSGDRVFQDAFRLWGQIP